jgi:hypothetical protein
MSLLELLSLSLGKSHKFCVWAACKDCLSHIRPIKRHKAWVRLLQNHHFPYDINSIIHELWN